MLLHPRGESLQQMELAVSARCPVPTPQQQKREHETRDTRTRRGRVVENFGCSGLAEEERDDVGTQHRGQGCWTMSTAAKIFNVSVMAACE